MFTFGDDIHGRQMFVDVNGSGKYFVTSRFQKVQVVFPGHGIFGQIRRQLRRFHVVDVIGQIADVDAHFSEGQADIIQIGFRPTNYKQIN